MPYWNNTYEHTSTINKTIGVVTYHLRKFAYNNGYQETIKNKPFFANYGINPEYEMIGHLIEGKQVEPKEITQLHESLREEMVAPQIRQKEYYDLHREPDPNLQAGDMILLLPRNIKTTRTSKKLDYKKIGQFEILEKSLDKRI